MRLIGLRDISCRRPLPAAMSHSQYLLSATAMAFKAAPGAEPTHFCWGQKKREATRMTLLPHQKQFILGPADIKVRPDWKVVPLGERLVLSHCPKLRTVRLRSSDGMEFYLLGLAVLANETASIPDRFEAKHSSEIEDWSGYWAGRWALLSAQRCCQDAGGLLGIYYRQTKDGVWLSSSPALLGNHLPHIPAAERIPWQVKHQIGMDWIPTPFTTRREIRRLLPQRTIDPRTGSMQPVRFVVAKVSAGSDAQTFATCLKTVLLNWQRTDFRERFAGLTAGLDTRTMLAAASAARIPLQTFTNMNPHLREHDRELPPKLAACVGFDHWFVSNPGLTADEIEIREAAIHEHTDDGVFHPTVELCASGRSDLFNNPERTIATGITFEIGRCFYWNQFKNAGFRDEVPSAARLLDAFFLSSPTPRMAWIAALEEWIGSLSEPMPLTLDWRDRFYLDQRLGAWASAVQRTLDILDGSYFYPGNCLWLFHLMLQPEPAARKSGALQKEAIRILEPRLADLPINPTSIPEQVRNAVKLFRNRARLRSLRRMLGRLMSR